MRLHVHDLLLAYAHLCIVSCNPASLLKLMQTLLPPGPRPNKTEKYLLYDSALLLLSFLPGYQIVSSPPSRLILSVKYSPVIHIHSAQEPFSDVPRCLL